MMDYRAEARKAAERHGFDPDVYVRQIQQESGFRPDAVSPAGAIGIAQIMPATAKGWGVDPRDPIAALDAGAKNMAAYAKKYGSTRAALIAYNAGPGAVGRAKLPAETEHYLATILGANARAAGRSSGRQTGLTADITTTGGTKGRVTPAHDVPDPEAAARMAFAQGADPLHLPKLGSRGVADRAAELLTSGAATKTIPTSYAPGTDVKTTVSLHPAAGGAEPHGRTSVSSEGGSIRLTGANPGRVKSAALRFARQVSAVAGEPLSADTGATHSRLTVDGNVSQHSTGDALDIPAHGQRLIRLGRAALIAAGMPRAKAMKQTGGLYNVNGRQVIFNTHLGGDHTNHLHIGD